MNFPVSEEQPVDLLVNDIQLVTFLCTPGNLKELAVGHLFTKGLIDSLEDIMTLGACEDMRKIYVRLGKAVPKQGIELGQVLTSGCGSGGLIEQDLIKERKVNSSFTIDSEVLKGAFYEMNQQASRYQRTGGLHSAALVKRTGLTVVQEDVGRHNAIDKIVGAALFQGCDLSESGLITTGRLSLDMVLKAIIAGVPLVATRSIPTNLALNIAKTAGITLVGRAHLKKRYLYCHDKRVT